MNRVAVARKQPLRDFLAAATRLLTCFLHFSINLAKTNALFTAFVRKNSVISIHYSHNLAKNGAIYEI